jgi:hypothetical protein
MTIGTPNPAGLLTPLFRKGKEILLNKMSEQTKPREE